MNTFSQQTYSHQTYSHQTYTIRPATIADLDTIFQLIQLKASFDGCPNSVQATASQLQHDLFGNPSLVSILVAEVHGEVIGFSSYHSIYSTFLAKPGIWLDDLYLKPAFRGQGIGRALMQHLGQIAQENGCARIDWTVAVTNVSGMKFYEAMGATISSEIRVCRLDLEGIRAIASARYRG